MRAAIACAVAAVFVVIYAPNSALGQNKDSFKPKISDDLKEDNKAPEKPKTTERRSPGITAEDLYKVKPSASEEKLQAAIDSLYRIIDWAEEDDPEKPVYYARLANLYWEKAESYFMQAYSDELDQALMKAEEKNEEQELARLKAKRQLLLDSQREWRRKAIKIFEEIEQKYPDYEKLDMVLFYLGNFLTQMGKAGEGFEYYKKLVTRHPESKHLADALVNLGEYFFNLNEFDTAIEFYKRIESFKTSRIYPYALYKMAWCHYNMSEYEEAFKRFVDVIQYTRRMEKEGGARIGLKTEAQKDIVLAYSQIGKESKAIPFFKKVAPDVYLVLAARLAELYYDQGDFERSIRMYQNIIQEDPESPKILAYQRDIVRSADRTGDKSRSRKELARLVELYTALQEQNSATVARERDSIEVLLRTMAINYHIEAQKTGEKKAKLLAQSLYGYYLTLFPDGPGRYQMAMNHAILLYQVEKYTEAVKEYERVLEMDPKGKYAREAAYTSLLCYYKLIDISEMTTTVKTQEEDDVEKKPLPDLHQNMVNACDRFVEMGSEDPEELIQAQFAAAKILYDFNHFKKAAPRLAKVIQKYPEHEMAPDSATMLLSSYTLSRDIKNLNLWADKIYNMPALAKGDLLALIMKIRDQAKFNRCFEYEFEKQYEAAADCFVDYTKKFPESNIIDKSLYNAALNYQRARKYEKALKANEALYNCCARSSKLGPRALYLIADTYRMAAVYDLAAQFYEEYVKRHPNEQKVKKALVYASQFRRSLGDYRKAIKNYERFIKLFRKDPKVPVVYFDIGMLYMREGKWRYAIRHFEQYLRKYDNAGGINLRLSAYRQIGEAWLERRRSDRARKMSDKIIETFKELTPEERKQITGKGVSAIAWAFFNIGDEMFQEAGKIRLTRRKLKEATEKKMKVLLDAEKYYMTVLSLKQPMWSTAALYRIGSSWEKFAREFENSPVPPGLDAYEEEEYRFALSEFAEGFRKKAAAAYRECLKVAKKSRIFNDYTDKAQQHLSQLSIESAGLREYRIRPGYLNAGANPPAYRDRKVLIFKADETAKSTSKPAQEDESAPEEAGETGGGESK